MKKTSQIASLSCLLVVLLAIVVLVGWMLDYRILKSILPSAVTMKVNTAVCFLFAGTALNLALDYRRTGRKHLRRISYGLLAVVFLLSFSTLIQHLARVDLGIDQLLYHDEVEALAPFPGRMAFLTVFNFLLFCAAVSALIENFRRPAFVLALPAAAVTVGVLIGYLTGSRFFSGMLTMALHTAVEFAALTTGLIAAALDRAAAVPSSEASKDRESQERAAYQGMAAAVALLFVLGFASFRNQLMFRDAAEWRAHTYQVLRALEETLSSFTDAQTAQREYLIGGDEEFAKKCLERLQETREKQTSLRGLIADNEAQEDRALSLEEAIAAREKRLVETIELRRQNGFESSVARVSTGEGRNLMEKVLATAAAMRGEEMRLLAERNAATDMRAHNALVTTVFGTLVSVGLLATAFARLRREMRYANAVSDKVKALNVDLSVHADELATVNKELEAFSYSVSHDLRAPLRAIDGFSKILQEDYGPKIDEEGGRLLRVVRANVRMMGQLIDDLLAFSRLSRTQLQKVRVDMSALASAAAEDLKAGKPVEVTLLRLPAAQADPMLIKQVWVNLISNAIKYSGKSAKPAVEIGCEITRDELTYYVKDNGVGFDMRYADKLFGVFQRLHSAEEFEGTGVGLALVQRIVGRHGGRVWAESKLGEGATFRFALPK